MVVKVLGPLDTGTDALGSRERTMLSALVVRRGSTVAPADLAEAWWGETPPRTWEQQVRNAVARIRSRLGRESVETVGWQYRLGVDPESIDAVRFERLVSSARGHALRGEHPRAIDAYGKALALWRGAPLQDVADWGPGVAEALRLDEIRASAEEERLDSRLAVGEHRSMIADAERLLREQPLREDRWAIVALANYRADRQAEALAVLRAARERLADEFGIEPGARLTSLELGMLRHDPALDAPAAGPVVASVCPYPGLRPFDADDADFFFGRDADTEAVLERLAPGAIVTIAGVSGTGKSSLLLAGVCPRLVERGRTVEVVRPGSGGLPALRRAIAQAQVIAVDQAEELLAADEADIARFVELVRRHLDDGGSVIVTVRSDALDRIRSLTLIGDGIGRGVYLLGALSEEAYRAAIEQAAKAAGLAVEPGLVELAVRDAGDRASTLPHLSHAMQETWVRREGATLTVAGYEDSGGIAGAIAQSAEDCFRSLTHDEQAICRALMLRLLDRRTDGVTTRRHVPAAPLLADADRRRVLERLTRARLVTSDDDDAVVVAHEAIASAWPRLDAWLEEDAEGARTLRAIETAAMGWDAGGRSEDDLLRGARLHSALDWREAAHPDLTGVEDALLAASVDREQREIRELSERASHERRRNRVLGVALTGAGVLLVAALAAGGFAAVRGQEAAVAAENARIEALVSTSLALRSSDREVAAILAAAAYQQWPDDGRVRSALWGTVTAAGALAATNRFDADRAMLAAIPGTGTALAVTDTGDTSAALIVDAVTGDVRETLDIELPVNRLRFPRDVTVSEGGRVAVVQTAQYVGGDSSSCCRNALTFIDLATGDELPGSQVVEMRTSTAMVLDDDGTLYLEHPLTGDLIVVDGTTGDVRASDPAAYDDYQGVDSRYDSIAAVADDRIATGLDDRIRVYDRRSLGLVSEFAYAPGFASSALIADGAGGVIASGTSTLSRIDASTGEILWQHNVSPSQVCGRLLLLPGGDTFACSTLGGLTELRVADGTPTGLELGTQIDDELRPTIIGDSSILLSAAVVGPIWLTARIDGSGAVSRPAAEGMRLANPADDVTGLVPVIAQGLGEMRLWDFERDQPVGPPSDWIGTMGGGIAERWSQAGGSLLEDVTTGRTYPYRIDGLPDEYATIWAGRGRPYLAFDGTAYAVDPATGEPAGPGMRLVPEGAGFELTAASETPTGDRAVLSWWNDLEGQTFTGVFDVATGERLGDGLVGRDGSLALSDEQFIAVSNETVQRIDLDTLQPLGNLPRAAGGSRALSMSPDGRTLLNVGWNDRVTLYDLTRDVVLGDPIQADSGDEALAATLSADGRSLLTTAPDGVLVWSLDPAEQAAAACRIAGRELTAAEWSTYLDELGPQSPICADVLG